MRIAILASGLLITPAQAADISAAVERCSERYRLDRALVYAVIAVESAGNPNAVSHKGAQGLMQLMPATAQRFGVANAFDPVQNILGGCRYLRWLLDVFDGDITLALAGYNAGEGAVVRHQGVPPYRETQRYVKNVLARWGRAGRFAPVAPATSAVAGFGERLSWAALVAANRHAKKRYR